MYSFLGGGGTSTSTGSSNFITFSCHASPLTFLFFSCSFSPLMHRRTVQMVRYLHQHQHQHHQHPQHSVVVVAPAVPVHFVVLVEVTGLEGHW